MGGDAAAGRAAAALAHWPGWGGRGTPHGTMRRLWPGPYWHCAACCWPQEPTGYHIARDKFIRRVLTVVGPEQEHTN